MRYKSFVKTLHCAIENGAVLYVNKSQKIRHYCARSAEKYIRRRKRKKKNPNCYFNFARCLSKIAVYGDVIH